MKTSTSFQWAPQGLLRFAGALAFGWGVVCAPALAHKGSDAYLDVQQISQAADADHAANTRDFKFTLAVAIKDLDLVLPLDGDANGSVTWGEVKAATPQVLALFNQAAQIDAESAAASAAMSPDSCRLDWSAAGLERRGDGVYLRAESQARCPATMALRFRYLLLKDQDATHRLLVAGRIGGTDLLSTTAADAQSLLLSPGRTAGAGRAGVAGGTGALGNASGSSMSTTSNTSSSRLSALRDYFSLGMHHLLEGYDHLAFLLALVLPLQLSLRRRPGAAAASGGSSGDGGGSMGAPAFAGIQAGFAARAAAASSVKAGAEGQVAYASRATWLTLLRTITAFTLGHSITLMLATFGLTQASPQWVEPVIALSIAVTALLNLRPVAWVRFDVLALVFGLVHGFGFAGLLQEAAAPGGLLPWALAGFNLGVEGGQLTAVAGWVLVSQALVGKPWYQAVVVRGGSVVLFLLASWWFYQRVV